MKLSHSTSRTTIHLRSALAFAALGALATACSDTSSAPQQRAMSEDRPVLDVLVGSSTITYDPSRTSYVSVGGSNMIFLPEGGVCDPSTSSYGMGQWDKPCNTLTHPLTITASSYLDTKGHPYIQFSPALRFVPGKYVVLYVADSKATFDATAHIRYCPDQGQGACINEANNDPSLFTFHWSNGVYRRIKHFSGYNVAAGLDDLRDGLFSRSAPSRAAADRNARSGYMVVSGIELPRDPRDSTNFDVGNPNEPEK